MCIGLDNTSLLPPFPPTGRGEEAAFGAILTACFSHCFAAHLPILVQHDPVDAKRFPAAEVLAVHPGSWLRSCIGQFDPGLTSVPETRLCRLGHFLTDLGQLPEVAFDEFTQRLRLDQRERADYESGGQAGWTRVGSGVLGAGARQFIARARRSALRPADQWYATVGGRAALQRLLRQFGQLLIWWPAIIQAARDLRAAGHRLAQPAGGAA